VSVDFNPEPLLRQIDDLRKRLGASEKAWVLDDLRDLTIEICERVASSLHIAELEGKRRSETELDADAVASALARLRAVPVADFHMPGSKTFNASDRLSRLDSLVESMRMAAQLPALELALRMTLMGDGTFDDLLIAMNGHDDVRRALRDEARKKLAFLGDDKAVDLLARYEAETGENRRIRIVLDEDVARTTFRASTADEARDRCADYIAMHRPIAERRMLDRGATHFPADYIGLAQILSWTSSDPPEFTSWDRQIIAATSRVAVCWAETLNSADKLAMLAAALRVPVDGYIVAGRGRQQEREHLEQSPTREALIAELEKLTHLAARATESRPVEDALRAYCAGLEVMGSESRKLLLPRHEKRLQRDVCRFLVERGHRAVGVSFGGSEVDLRVEDTVGAILIEAKKNTTAASESKIRGWFSQLQDYMSKEVLRNRGVLLIYNFHATPIFAPRGYLHSRYLVLAVNLCPETASGLYESVLIEESTDDGVFINVRRNRRTDKPRRRAAKQTVKKTRRAKT